jgi:type VI secretion system protein ImpJ
MANTGMIHWHEGLFLQPHHLQNYSREVRESIGRERRLAFAYPYGVLDCKISSDGLENNLVRLDRLHVVMPSGLEIDVPGNASVPALDIKRIFANNPGGFTVSLAVPLYQEGRANTIESIGDADVRIKRLYRISETASPDENTGENSQPMLVRKINARLVTDADDTTDMEVIPLLRIMASAEESTIPRPDSRFIPPCMTISGSPTLKNLLRDLANAVEAARKELVNQLTRGGYSVENIKPPQMLMILRLTTLNRFAGRLPSLFAGSAGAGTISPLEAYLELRELQGELAALAPDRDPFEAPKYDHDLPGIIFTELDRKIRPLLRSESRGRFIQIPFIKDPTNVLGVSVTDEQFAQANGFYVAIKTKMDPTLLAKLVEDQDKFKLMPKSMIKLNIFGARLVEDRHPPMELPSATDLHYFRIDVGQSQKMWERIVQEKSIALRWSDQEPMEYTDISLYLTVP